MAEGETIATGAHAPARKNADLPVRIASAAVMLAVAVGAMLAGDPWLDIFIVAVVATTMVELVLLVMKATASWPLRIVGFVAGAAYVVAAGLFMTQFPLPLLVGVIGAVIFVDTFAYFTGRTLGGPKIAPAISPSKTWAGLMGAVIGATLWVAGWIYVVARSVAGENTLWFEPMEMLQILGIGAMVAVAAQAGDFFESWLKRKAGVKDSSSLIPGHGGVFDRTDGMIPVAILAGLLVRGIS